LPVSRARLAARRLGVGFGFPLGKGGGTSLVGPQRFFQLLAQALVLSQRLLQLLLQGSYSLFKLLFFELPGDPVAVSATGISHVAGETQNIAYLTLLFRDNLIAHIHVNWLAPVKIRRTPIWGSRRMLIYDDVEGSEKIKFYNRGIQALPPNGHQARGSCGESLRDNRASSRRAWDATGRVLADKCLEGAIDVRPYGSAVGGPIVRRRDGSVPLEMEPGGAAVTVGVPRHPALDAFAIKGEIEDEASGPRSLRRLASALRACPFRYRAAALRLGWRCRSRRCGSPGCVRSNAWIGSSRLRIARSPAAADSGTTTFPADYQGRNLAVTMLRCPFLSWQGVVLGDPLCSLGKP
jgi:hypothetical protein